MDAVGMDEELSSEDVEAYITDLTDRFGFLEEAIAESETTMVELQQELTRISESPSMEQGDRIDAVVEELTEVIEQAGSNHDLSALKRVSSY